MKRVLIGIGVLILLLPLLMRLKGLDHGEVKDGVYFNRHLRMSIRPPMAWFPLSHEEIINQMRANWQDAQGVAVESIENKRTKQLFYVLESRTGAGQWIIGSLIAEARKIGYPGGIPSVRHHLERMKTLGERGKYKPRIVQDISTVQIGNVNGMALFTQVQSASTRPDGTQLTVRIDYYAFEKRGYSILIIATYGDEEEESIRKALSSLKVRE